MKPLRRLSVCASSLLLASLLLHREIAVALVLRGDELLYRNEIQKAQILYERAFQLDRMSSAAVDRLVFSMFQTGTEKALHAGVDMATVYLRTNPGNATILSDRALCNLRLRRYRPAADDLLRVAQSRKLVGDYLFAGWCYRRAGNKMQAIRSWRMALALRPRFAPALAALKNVQ